MPSSLLCHFIILINESPKSHENIPIIAIKKNNRDSVLYGVKDSLLPPESLKDPICVPLELCNILVNCFLKLIVGQRGILRLMIQVSDSEL